MPVKLEQTCTKCLEVKACTEFYFNHNGMSNVWMASCKECHTVYTREHYRANLEHQRSIKMARGCADCGFNTHPEALHFDHLPGFTKTKEVSRLIYGTRTALDNEIAKCEVVCANCHAIRTAGRREDI